MKTYFILLSMLFLAACTTRSKNRVPEISDSLATALIKTAYTVQNAADGSEFATVDTLTLLQKTIQAEDSSCTVLFHIHCSYQSAAMPPGTQRTPPALDTDTSILFKYEGKWVIKK